MQRPSIPPPIKPGRNLNIIETRANIRNNPEDKEQAHPRHTHHHSYILARKAQGNHAEEVQHPVHDECAAAIRHRVTRTLHCRQCFAGDWVCVGEVDLEGEGDERIG